MALYNRENVQECMYKVGQQKESLQNVYEDSIIFFEVLNTELLTRYPSVFPFIYIKNWNRNLASLLENVWSREESCKKCVFFQTDKWKILTSRTRLSPNRAPRHVNWGGGGFLPKLTPLGKCLPFLSACLPQHGEGLLKTAGAGA